MSQGLVRTGESLPVQLGEPRFLGTGDGAVEDSPAAAEAAGFTSQSTVNRLITLVRRRAASRERSSRSMLRSRRRRHADSARARSLPGRRRPSGDAVEGPLPTNNELSQHVVSIALIRSLVEGCPLLPADPLMQGRGLGQLGEDVASAGHCMPTLAQEPLRCYLECTHVPPGEHSRREAGGGHLAPLRAIPHRARDSRLPRRPAVVARIVSRMYDSWPYTRQRPWSRRPRFLCTPGLTPTPLRERSRKLAGQGGGRAMLKYHRRSYILVSSTPAGDLRRGRTHLLPWVISAPASPVAPPVPPGARAARSRPGGYAPPLVRNDVSSRGRPVGSRGQGRCVLVWEAKGWWQRHGLKRPADLPSERLPRVFLALGPVSSGSICRAVALQASRRLDVRRRDRIPVRQGAAGRVASAPVRIRVPRHGVWLDEALAVGQRYDGSASLCFTSTL